MLVSQRTAAAYGLLCVAGLGRALAQNTELVLEASTNEGQTWTREVSASPGATVYVRVRVRLANAGTNTVLGLAGITYQPTLTNWRVAVDSHVPFTDDRYDVPEVPTTNTGVMAPFRPRGGGNPGIPQNIVPFADPGNLLRFAQPNNPSMTTNLAWGVPCGQLPASIATPPTTFRTGTDATVFRYAVTLGDAGPRDMLASVPFESILARRGSWYRTAAGTGSLLAPFDPVDPGIFPATIHVIPSPPALLALAGGVLLATRRRRN